MWSRGVRTCLRAHEVSCLQLEANTLAAAIRAATLDLHAVTGSAGVGYPSMPRMTPLTAMIFEQSQHLARTQAAQRVAQDDHDALMRRLRREQTSVVGVFVAVPLTGKAVEDQILRDVQTQVAQEDYERRKKVQGAADDKLQKAVERKTRPFVESLASHELHETHSRSLVEGEEQSLRLQTVVRMMSESVAVLEREGLASPRGRGDSLYLRDIKLLLRCARDEEDLGRSEIAFEADTALTSLKVDWAKYTEAIKRHLAGIAQTLEECARGRSAVLTAEADAWRDISLVSFPLRVVAVEVQESVWRHNTSEWEAIVRASVLQAMTSHETHMAYAKNFQSIHDGVRRVTKRMATTEDEESMTRSVVEGLEEEGLEGLVRRGNTDSATMRLSLGILASYNKIREAIVGREGRHWAILLTEVSVDRAECLQAREALGFRKEKMVDGAVVVQALMRARVWAPERGTTGATANRVNTTKPTK